ncbi:MAG: hypothetical protein GC158_16965 [Cyanobacteria bacterium RI_101]|nr:hypothetical protein [Cyanobacteria bacterium RI_101]
MKPLEVVFLLITIAIATLVIFLLQPAMLSKEWGLLAAKSSSIEDWRQQLMWPSLAVNYVLGILATLFWIAKGASFKSVKSRNTLSMVSLWWIICIAYGLISLAVAIGLSFFYDLINERYFLEFLVYLSVFAVVDVLLMFWLPTAIATPRTMRYVPPGSQLLRSIYGG